MPFDSVEQVWALVSGLPTPQRTEWRIVALQGYIDDSGEGDDLVNPVFVLAGFIASAEQWAIFSDEWAAALAAEPAVEYFRMAEAGNLNGQFSRRRGWTVSTRDTKVQLLTGIILRHARWKVHCTVDKKAFAAHVRRLTVPRRTALVNKPYALAFQHIILATASTFFVDEIHDSCDFIFDEQGTVGTEAVAMWENLKVLVAANARKPGRYDFSPHMGQRPIFRDDKVFLPLQAADLYAWHVRRHFYENKVLYMPLRRALRDLEAVSTVSRHLGEVELADLAQTLEQGATVFAANNPDVPLVGYQGTVKQQKAARAEARHLKSSARSSQKRSS